MKKQSKYVVLILIMIIFVTLIVRYLTDFSSGANSRNENQNYYGKVYIYGEKHASHELLDLELNIWSDYYVYHGMRHLFLEMPYFTAEMLNLWMQAEDDKIIDAIFESWKGTFAYNQSVLEFYKNIKRKCPETIFHGTDVGHQYSSLGK